MSLDVMIGKPSPNPETVVEKAPLERMPDEGGGDDQLERMLMAIKRKRRKLFVAKSEHAGDGPLLTESMIRGE